MTGIEVGLTIWAGLIVLSLIHVARALLGRYLARRPKESR